MKKIIIILLLCLLFRFLFLETTDGIFGDESIWSDVGKNIALNNKFTSNVDVYDPNGKIIDKPFTLHPPILFCSLGGFYKFFGVGLFQGRLFSVIISTLTALLFYLLVREKYDEKIAFLAFLFFSLSPFFIYYGKQILMDPISLFFFIGSLYFWVKGKKDDKTILFYLSGMFLALSLLSKYNFLFLFYFPFIFLDSKFDWKKCLKPLLIFILFLMPYLIFIGVNLNLWLDSIIYLQFTSSYDIITILNEVIVLRTFLFTDFFVLISLVCTLIFLLKNRDRFIFLWLLLVWVPIAFFSYKWVRYWIPLVPIFFIGFANLVRKMKISHIIIPIFIIYSLFGVYMMSQTKINPLYSDVTNFLKQNISKEKVIVGNFEFSFVENPYYSLEIYEENKDTINPDIFILKENKTIENFKLIKRIENIEIYEVQKSI